MQMHLKTVEVNAAALEAACVARGAAGGRAFPAKCNHQDLLSSLSVLPGERLVGSRSLMGPIWPKSKEDSQLSSSPVC